MIGKVSFVSITIFVDLNSVTVLLIIDKFSLESITILIQQNSVAVP
jgi:hypothetical protein